MSNKIDEDNDQKTQQMYIGKKRIYFITSN